MLRRGEGRADLVAFLPGQLHPIRYQAGPRASVLIHEGLAYSLGAIGRVVYFEEPIPR